MPIPPVYKSESSPPSALPVGPRLACSSDVFAQLSDIRTAQQETFVVFDLNVRHRVIARRVVSLGSLTGCEVHPRETFRGAITNGAAAIIMAHNHPSGDPSPSHADVELTARLREVGELVGIPVLDHVIVAETAFISLAERNWK